MQEPSKPFYLRNYRSWERGAPSGLRGDAMSATLVLLLGVALGVPVGRWLAMRRAMATVSQAEVRMRRELVHWQEAAQRATAEAARVAREAEAYKAGCKHGREDVISIMPLLVAAQQQPDAARVSGDIGPYGR
jgi:hypothetical protein